MRHSIRHPSDIPIEVSVDEIDLEQREAMNDVGFGGLSFQSRSYIKAGTNIIIRIPSVEPPFETAAKVRWCRKRSGGYYDIGVAFPDREEAFRTRMVEQICHIEHYKREVWEREGRRLSGEEAAAEWIGRYAATFPSSETERTE